MLHRSVLPLTRKHQRHTSRNTAGRAPQCGTLRRVPESTQHTFSWPMSLCEGSAKEDSVRTSGKKHPTLCECVCIYQTYSTGVPEILVCHIRAGGADLPRVPKQLGRGLHNPLPCCKVIFRVSIKVSTQAPNPPPKMGCQAHIHTHTLEKKRKLQTAAN